MLEKIAGMFGPAVRVEIAGAAAAAKRWTRGPIGTAIMSCSRRSS